MDINQEKEFEKVNTERLSSLLPKKLAEREDKIGKQLATAKTSPQKKLEILYSFMAEIYRHVLPLTPCKGGCSFCCYYPVSICEIEIAFIERNAKKKRLKTYAQKSDFHGTACPFLEKGRCSIYDSRPFVCRRHVALTKTNFWCDPVRSNDEIFSLLNFTGIEEAFDGIRRQSNSYDMFDIRQVFKGRTSDNHLPAEIV